MIKFRRLIASITIMFFVMCHPVHAFIPAAIGAYVVGSELSSYFVGSVVAHVAAGGLLTYLTWPSSSAKSPKVHANGDIKVPSEAVWVDLKNFNPTVESASISARAKQTDIANIVKNNPDKYPNLAQAMFDRKIDTIDELQHPNVDNQNNFLASPLTKYRRSDGKFFGILAVEPGGATCYTGADEWQASGAYGASHKLIHYGGRIAANSTQGAGCGPPGTIYSSAVSYIYINFNDPLPDGTSILVGPPLSKLPDRATANLTAPMSQIDNPLSEEVRVPTDVYSDYYGDIDSFIHDNPNVLHFEDSTASDVDVVDFVPPVPATLDQVNKANLYQSAQSAASAAQTASNNAKEAYVASGGNPATGQGGDAGLFKSYADSLKDVATTSKDASDAKASVTGVDSSGTSDGSGGSSGGEGGAGDSTDYTPGSVSNNSYDSAVDTPEKKSISNLISQAISASPLASIINSFRLDTSNQTSSLSWSFAGQEITIDFSRWDTFIAGMGATMLAFSHVYGIFVIFRKVD